MIDQSLLFLCRLLLFQRFKLFATVVFSPLNETLPVVSLLIEGALMLDKEVIEELKLDEVLLGDQVRVLFRQIWILFFLLVVDTLTLLRSLL